VGDDSTVGVDDDSTAGVDDDSTAGVDDDSIGGVGAAIGVLRAITPRPVVGVDATIGVPDDVGDGSVAEFEQAAVASKATKIATAAMQSLTVKRLKVDCRLCILLSGDILECVYKYTVARDDHRYANNNVHNPAGYAQSGDLGRMLLPAQAPVNYTRWLNTSPHVNAGVMERHSLPVALVSDS